MSICINVKKIVKCTRKFFFDRRYRTLFFSEHHCYDHLGDEDFLKMIYKVTMETELDLADPKTFNEKLQWLKLYDRKPEYTMMVDKYKVREYIADKLGKEYLIPLLGVWENPDDIDFDALPNQFVLKCNHNSGLGMYICKDKSKSNISKVKMGLCKGLQQNYYITRREWPYKDVKRKIIAEKYMVDNGTNELNGDLKDYKIWCFNGVPKIVLVCTERFSEKGLHEDFFDMEWNHLSLKRPNSPQSEVPIKCPQNFQLMQQLAQKISVNIPFVRADFYEINGNVYFGEMTFFPATGMQKFEPEEWDYKLGELIDLSEIMEKQQL